VVVDDDDVDPARGGVRDLVSQDIPQSTVTIRVP
jgi:hypothetical protein